MVRIGEFFGAGAGYSPIASGAGPRRSRALRRRRLELVSFSRRSDQRVCLQRLLIASLWWWRRARWWRAPCRGWAAARRCCMRDPCGRRVKRKSFVRGLRAQVTLDAGPPERRSAMHASSGGGPPHGPGHDPLGARASLDASGSPHARRDAVTGRWMRRTQRGLATRPQPVSELPFETQLRRTRSRRGARRARCARRRPR